MNDEPAHRTYGSTANGDGNLNRLDAVKDDNAGSPGTQRKWVSVHGQMD